jgi:Salmonella virulence plasmid 65kDa B protein
MTFVHTLARSLLLGAACLSGFLSVARVADAAVGHLSATPRVSLSGEAQYVIPIFTPPGAKGMAPSLALAYSHRTKEGLAGVGWSLSGLSEISRCPATFVQNSSVAEVKLVVSDRYCLDGNQLRRTSGVYGTSGSVYRLEFDTAARITASGAAGNGPAFFTVEQKSGLIYEYGNSGDSRIESLSAGFTTTVRTWALNKIRDREGNSITFTYQEDGPPNGEYRVLSIAYASNPGQFPPAAQYTVSFTYETQPATDVDSQYTAGGRRDETRRLTQIEVTHLTTATRVRRYTITYATAPVTARSRVDTVQECAGPGTTPDCFPATQFYYQNGSQGFAPAVSTGTTVNGPLSIDINGDGRSDLVYSTTATSGTGFWAYRLANSSGGYDAAVTTTFANTNFAAAIAIDYNADGRDDVLVPQNGTTWAVMQATTTGGLQAPFNTGAPYAANYEAIALDYNGDGLDDLVYRDATVGLYVRTRVWGAAFSTTATLILTGVISPGFAGQHAKARLRGLDVNGDGRRDFMVVVQSACGALPCFYNMAVLGGGLGTWSMGLGATVTRKPIDINGDGYTDVFDNQSSTLTWSISSGKSFVAGATGPSLTNFDFPKALARDYDGDGFEDVLIPNTSTGTWFWSRSNGTGLGSLTNTGIASNAPTITLPIDANGDGLDDIGYVTLAGVYAHLPHAGVKADLLTRAVDGFGNEANFTNIPITQSGYTRGTSAVYPQQDYQGPVYVARTVTASDGIGGLYSLTYSYTGAQVNLQGRGLTGFTTRSVVDSRNSISVTETYRHDFPFIGALVKRETNQPGGTLIHRLHNDNWLSVDGGSGSESYKLPYVQHSLETQNEVGGAYNGATIRSTATTTVVDAYGSPTDVTTTTTEPAGANGVQAGASYTQRTVHSLPADNTSNWCVSKPTQTQFINSHNQAFGASITPPCQ